jgi:uroporphyrinogen-III synthase
VEGCADGLGLESLPKVWTNPLLGIQKNDVTILTHESAAKKWQLKSWSAVATYRNHVSPETPSGIQAADIVFWTSGTQFQNFRHLVKSTATHVCASGETLEQLKRCGIEPIVFPTIQSFQQWKTNAILSPIEG